ncbi:MobA/MobL family protein [Oscillatoriales cyanobacterium LEGE 11467]|uniref:MobA/MobL family protein n=1 Tax=Zarconia navalis LEGE 11467 TaxID=1828826 RepID=A0A928VYV6_9CYAN|nr:MobA/MobL family protein [Zarconia navalis]MBE9040200.1 MobA/MobL family protein [Zarconia navalis LEGE 11467]
MAVYHFSVKHSSRSSGGSAGGHALYIGREGKYQNRNDDLGFFQSWNMPDWSQGDPIAFWQAADDYERANGRLYTELEFALPRELSPEARERLAREFADEQLSNRHPYALAIHNPLGLDRKEQPHAHLMFSERRVDDGISRSPEQFFKRANGKNPERGGAKKDRDWNRIEKVSELRVAWEEAANAALAREGYQERIDRRSLKERGIDRPPEPKLGFSQTAMLRRGELSIAAIEVLALRQERILSELMQLKSSEFGVLGSELSLSSDLRPQMEKPEPEEVVLGKTLLAEVNEHIKMLDGQLNEVHREREALGLEQFWGVGMWHYPDSLSEEEVRKRVYEHLGSDELREVNRTLASLSGEHEWLQRQMKKQEGRERELGIWRYLPHEALKLRSERIELEERLQYFRQRYESATERHREIWLRLTGEQMKPQVEGMVSDILSEQRRQEVARPEIERRHEALEAQLKQARDFAHQIKQVPELEIAIVRGKGEELPQLSDKQEFEQQVELVRLALALSPEGRRDRGLRLSPAFGRGNEE